MIAEQTIITDRSVADKLIADLKRAVKMSDRTGGAYTVSLPGVTMTVHLRRE
jgi:hypothetical protein